MFCIPNQRLWLAPFAAAALATLLFAPNAAVAQQTAPEWQDSVRTLPLNDTLEAWGNLGGVTVDRLGFVYVANFRDAVWRVAPDGKVRLMTGSLYGASGNAIDSRGDLYQANFFANTISRITRDGDVSTHLTDGLAGPVGLVFDSDDNLYVCNCSNNTVARITPQREVTTFATSPDFNCPNGLTFDSQGNLYVVSFSNSHIVKVTPEGAASRLATLSPGGNAHIAFARGALFVTRIRNQQIDRVTLAGESQTIAGTGELGAKDGPAGEATFATPNGIAVSPSGDVLYVNTLVGEWQSATKGAMQIRAIDLATLAEVLQTAYESAGSEGMERAYREYKEDAARAYEHTLTEVSALAFRFLNRRDVGSALSLFQLNAESYPDDWRVHANLGFVYAIIGQPESAIEAYERSLELNPDNANTRARLAALKGQ